MPTVGPEMQRLPDLLSREYGHLSTMQPIEGEPCQITHQSAYDNHQSIKLEKKKICKSTGCLTWSGEAALQKKVTLCWAYGLLGSQGNAI